MKKGIVKSVLVSTLAISFLLAGCGTKAAPSGVHTYVGSANSSIYHYPSCAAAKKIKESNEVWFSDVSDAKGAGYVPCRVCKPPIQ